MVEEKWASCDRNGQPEAAVTSAFAFAPTGSRASDNDLRYYRKRAAQEQAAAAKSRDARVRRVHLEMAKSYADLVFGLEEVPAE